MRDKTMSAAAVAAEIKDGMTIGIGGWGSRRKPMALITAILRTDVRDLTVVSFGGPDVGLLCAAGKVRELVFGFVSLDSIPYDPFFAKARQDGAIRAREFDEMGRIDKSLYRKMGELGMLGLRYDPKWGGAGLDPAQHAIGLGQPQPRRKAPGRGGLRG